MIHKCVCGSVVWWRWRNERWVTSHAHTMRSEDHLVTCRNSTPKEDV